MRSREIRRSSGHGVNRSFLLVSLVLFIFLASSFLVPVEKVNKIQNTMASVSAGSSNSIQYYINVTVSNKQSTATLNPFNQQVTVNSSRLEEYENSNLSNIIWFTSTLIVIPSWIESGDSNSSNSTVYWLKIPLVINASSQVTIFMGFENKTVNLFSSSGSEGVAPGLTSVYGQLDNGGNVFTNYWNFKGTSAPQGWTLNGSTVDNGIFLNYQTRGMATYQISQSFQGIMETYSKQIPSQSSAHAYSQIGIKGNYTGPVWAEPSPLFGYSSNYIYPSASNQNLFLGKYPESASEWGLVGTSTTSAFYYNANYVTKMNISYGNPQYILLWSGGTNGTSLTVQYVFLTPLQPDNIMPSTAVSYHVNKEPAFKDISPNPPSTPRKTISLSPFIQNLLIGVVAGVILALVLLVYYSRVTGRKKDEDEESDLESYYPKR